MITTISRVVRSFTIQSGECSPKDADFVDILKDTLTSSKKRCFNGNLVYLPILGVETEESEPPLAKFFT